MKTKVNFSVSQGRKDDKKFHSVSEFCRIVANDCTNDIYGYFTSFYAAFLADTSNEKKHESESNTDFKNRVLRVSFQRVKSISTKDLKESTLYKTFSSKNQLFKLIRSIMPAFYDDENNHKFAKVQKIAFNTSNLTKEQIQNFLDAGYKLVVLDIPAGKCNQPKGKVIEIITKHFKTENGVFDEYLTKGWYYNKLDDETRKQRKEKFADMKESTIYFFDEKENICTLVENDKMNFQTMYSYISEYAQRENFAKVESQQQKEKKTNFQKKQMKNNQKFDDEISRTFNKLLEYRNKVSKEHKNQYITEENDRNLVLAGFIKYTTEYKKACQKRFENWNENENEFLKDTGKVVHILTNKPVTKETTKKTTKKSTKKADTNKLAA